MTAGTAFGLRADVNISILSKAALQVSVLGVPRIEDAISSVPFANAFACLVGLRGAPPPLSS